jgi:hypothetical protein
VSLPQERSTAEQVFYTLVARSRSMDQIIKSGDSYLKLAVVSQTALLDLSGNTFSPALYSSHAICPSPEPASVRWSDQSTKAAARRIP